tara:strand:- start:62700 stop:63233 length:534 start_codon:yes stop_codon:yes gene_type:complete
LKNLIANIFIVFLILSCKNKDEKIIDNKKFERDPVGTAYNVKMFYSDSAKTKAILTSPKHNDFTNQSLNYSEFPDGVNVTFFDNNNNRNTVVSDYGILYNSTSIVDLRGNVILKSHDNSVLKTSQLFWDAESDWIFTEEDFTFTSEDYNMTAVRLDTNKEFSDFQTGEIRGEVLISD